ncbi:MAG: hypothetical protein K9H49_15585 [Bacteroidales bacterium]|nr:hypothetical protein [Bacteroidales bacterium]
MFRLHVLVPEKALQKVKKNDYSLYLTDGFYLYLYPKPIYAGIHILIILMDTYRFDFTENRKC